MSIWKRFSDWWWGIPKNPIEQDDYGNTVIWPVGPSVHRKIWRLLQPAFTSLSKFMTFLIVTVLAGVIAWGVTAILKDLTGLG